MSEKKKKVTIGKKLEALSRIDKGEAIKDVAAQLGVKISTVSDWKKHRKELEDYSAKMIFKDNNRGTMKKGKNVALDEALYLWYVQEIEKGIPISGMTLREKAISLNKKLGCDSTFVASGGWLGGWKSRYGIKLSFAGESLLEDPVTDDCLDQLVLEDA